MNCTDPKVYVDHINGNRLDQRKSNLRLCTSLENSRNKQKQDNSSSQFVGVSFDKVKLKWCASIRHDNKSRHLGYFNNEIDAAKARDDATRKHFGGFGQLNFPDEDGN